MLQISLTYLQYHNHDLLLQGSGFIMTPLLTCHAGGFYDALPALWKSSPYTFKPLSE